MNIANLLKSATSIILCFAMVLLLTACGGSPSVNTESKLNSGWSSKIVIVNSDGTVTEVETTDGELTQSDGNAENGSQIGDVSNNAATVGTVSNKTSSGSASTVSGNTGASTTQSATATAQSVATAITGITPINPSNYYGRSKLSGSKAKLAAYDRIVEGAANMDDVIDLENNKYPLKESEIKEVVSYYKADYPQHFWVESSFEYSKQGSTVMSVMLNYTISKSKLSSAKNKFDSAVKSILSGISGSWSEYDREKTIHDRLAAKVTYKDSTNAHSSYGAIVEGSAVCEGYAKAFQYLCYQAGIQCLFVTGTSTNPDTNEAENHAWNQVKIDGSYYNVDLTWNDQGNMLFYSYFNTTDSFIKQDHTFGTNYALPSCTATAANYFVKNGSLLSSYSVDQMVNILKANGNEANFYFSNGLDGFNAWLNENHETIGSKLGLGAYKASVGTMTNEIYLVFKAT